MAEGGHHLRKPPTPTHTTLTNVYLFPIQPLLKFPIKLYSEIYLQNVSKYVQASTSQKFYPTHALFPTEWARG